MQQKPKRLVNHRNLLCCQTNLSRFVCSQQKCLQYPFICQQKQCKCHQLHKNCQSASKLSINSFMNFIQIQMPQNAKQRLQFIDAILDIYQHMIQRLSKDRIQFIQAVDKFYLGQFSRSFVNSAQQQSLNKITGELINKIKIQNRTSIIKPLPKKKQIQSNFTPYLKMFNDICDQLTKYNDYTLPLIKKINSQVLNAQNQNKIRSFLPKSVKQFNLLYRASQNNFSAKTFHSLCDGADHTLVVVLGHNNVVFGGYTPVPWNTPLSQRITNKIGLQVEDISQKSFIFSLHYNSRYKLINKQKAIIHNQGYGPCFSCDLMLCDSCNKNQQSVSIFPSSYGNNTEQDELIGSLNGNGKKNFLVKQYEVFKIIWKN